MFGFRTALAICICWGGLSACSHEPHWAYEGPEGPEHWAELSPSYAACARIQKQSPVDIPADVPPRILSEMSLDYKEAPVTLQDNGHTVQVTFTSADNFLVENGKRYQLKQFHFHAHSEHTWAGRAEPLEVHLVHQAADGELAVVSVWFHEGHQNTTLDEVFEKMELVETQPEILSHRLNPSQLIPSQPEGWRYEGSLTTPPCTEGVRWHVLARPLEVSAHQLAHFTKRHHHSYRPTTHQGF